MKNIRQRKRPLTGDLPFQSKGRRKFGGHETLTVPELRIWRAQQKVAVRLRRLRKKLNIRMRLFGATSSSINLVASLDLAARFVSQQSVEAVVERIAGVFGNREDRSLGVDILRRAVQVARGTYLSYRYAARHLWRSVTLQECYVCSRPHSTFSCLSSLALELSREEEHIVIASHRLALEADELVRREDALRIAASRRRQDSILRARLTGLVRLAWCIAKYTPLNVVLGPISTVLRLAEMGEELWYIATGVHLFEVPRASQLTQILYSSQTLLDLADAVLASQTRAVQESEDRVRRLSLLPTLDELRLARRVVSYVIDYDLGYQFLEFGGFLVPWPFRKPRYEDWEIQAAQSFRDILKKTEYMIRPVITERLPGYNFVSYYDPEVALIHDKSRTVYSRPWKASKYQVLA